MEKGQDLKLLTETLNRQYTHSADSTQREIRHKKTAEAVLFKVCRVENYDLDICAFASCKAKTN